MLSNYSAILPRSIWLFIISKLSKFHDTLQVAIYVTCSYKDWYATVLLYITDSCFEKKKYPPYNNTWYLTRITWRTPFRELQPFCLSDETQ